MRLSAGRLAASAAARLDSSSSSAEPTCGANAAQGKLVRCGAVHEQAASGRTSNSQLLGILAGMVVRRGRAAKQPGPGEVACEGAKLLPTVICSMSSCCHARPTSENVALLSRVWSRSSTRHSLPCLLRSGW